MNMNLFMLAIGQLSCASLWKRRFNLLKNKKYNALSSIKHEAAKDTACDALEKNAYDTLVDDACEPFGESAYEALVGNHVAKFSELLIEDRDTAYKYFESINNKFITKAHTLAPRRYRYSITYETTVKPFLNKINSMLALINTAIEALNGLHSAEINKKAEFAIVKKLDSAMLVMQNFLESKNTLMDCVHNLSCQKQDVMQNIASHNIFSDYNAVMEARDRLRRTTNNFIKTLNASASKSHEDNSYKMLLEECDSIIKKGSCLLRTVDSVCGIRKTLRPLQSIEFESLLKDIFELNNAMGIIRHYVNFSARGKALSASNYSDMAAAIFKLQNNYHHLKNANQDLLGKFEQLETAWIEYLNMISRIQSNRQPDSAECSNRAASTAGNIIDSDIN